MEATSDCCIPYRDCALRFEENRRYAAPPPVPVSDSTPDPPEVPEIQTWNRASMVFQPACRIKHSSRPHNFERDISNSRIHFQSTPPVRCNQPDYSKKYKSITFSFAQIISDGRKIMIVISVFY